MEVLDLGLIAYADAAEMQYALVEKISQGAEDSLLLLEHTPVITFGRNGGEEFLLAGAEALKAMGIGLIKSTRGGKITCHYPGQLVAYPIINLARWNKTACALPQRGLRGLYYGLEEAVILTLKAFGLIVARREGFPGVWTSRELTADGSGKPCQPGKICSIGTAVRHGVTYHGLALNVAADTTLFNMITLCGLPEAAPASLSGELGRTITVQEVKDVFKSNFLQLFI